MRITEIRHPEERQALKDFAFVAAQRDFLNMQDFNEEMERERLPARITLIDKDKLFEDDRIEIITSKI